MEACILICQANKSSTRKGRVLFINAVHMVHREGTYSFLSDGDIRVIADAYNSFAPQDGFCAVATVKEILDNGGSLRVSRYVHRDTSSPFDDISEEEVATDWMQASEKAKDSYDKFITLLGGGENAG